jgi:hypothetical protein
MGTPTDVVDDSIKRVAAFIASVMAAGSCAAAAVLPPELAPLMAKAGIEDTPSVWCLGHFQARTPNTFAAAVPSPNGGGRYLVFGLTEAAMELASFSGGPDLACYSPERGQETEREHRRLRDHSRWISPTFKTTVVCAFVDDTSAVCWQYSPATRAFVKVGGWVT